MKPKLYLDLDGVFVDFMKGIHTACNKKYSYQDYPYTKGEFNALVEDPNGISWTEINKVANRSFWATLPWMYDGIPMFAEILRITQEHLKPHILTKPIRRLDCPDGKKDWVYAAMPEVSADKVHVSRKPKQMFCGSPDDLLVDDCEANVDAWIAKGGEAILVPRHWNRLHKISNGDGPQRYVLALLETWINHNFK